MRHVRVLWSRRRRSCRGSRLAEQHVRRRRPDLRPRPSCARRPVARGRHAPRAAPGRRRRCLNPDERPTDPCEPRNVGRSRRSGTRADDDSSRSRRSPWRSRSPITCPRTRSRTARVPCSTRTGHSHEGEGTRRANRDLRAGGARRDPLSRAALGDRVIGVVDRQPDRGRDDDRPREEQRPELTARDATAAALTLGGDVRAEQLPFGTPEETDAASQARRRQQRYGRDGDGGGSCSLELRTLAPSLIESPPVRRVSSLIR